VPVQPARKVEGLHSTAADTVDDWSMKGEGWEIEVTGGDTQWFVPEKDALIQRKP